MDIFSSTNGMAVKKTFEAGNVASFMQPSISDDDLVIVTSVSFNQSANVQYQPSLKREMYIYSFGEKMGEVTISGVAFSKSCITKSAANIFSGLSKVLDYYKDNSVSKSVDSVKKISLAFGSHTIVGFLNSCSVSISSSDTTFISQFTLNIATIGA